MGGAEWWEEQAMRWATVWIGGVDYLYYGYRALARGGHLFAQQCYVARVQIYGGVYAWGYI